ncbi:MAG: hypothetical protein AAFS10_21880 [Myxococcota bacterium]
MIAGVLPPASAMTIHNPALLISLLPARSRQLLERPLNLLLAQDPGQRPSDARLIADDLERIRDLLGQEQEDQQLLDAFRRLAHLDGSPDPATAAYLAMLERELTRVTDAPPTAAPDYEQF